MFHSLLHRKSRTTQQKVQTLLTYAIPSATYSLSVLLFLRLSYPSVTTLKSRQPIHFKVFFISTFFNKHLQHNASQGICKLSSMLVSTPFLVPSSPTSSLPYTRSSPLCQRCLPTSGRCERALWVSTRSLRSHLSLSSLPFYSSNSSACLTYYASSCPFLWSFTSSSLLPAFLRYMFTAHADAGDPLMALPIFVFCLSHFTHAYTEEGSCGSPCHTQGQFWRRGPRNSRH